MAHVDVTNYRPPPAVTDAVRASAVSSAADAGSGADCALLDVGWRRVPFTWDNKQQGNANVKARLDRAMVNSLFLDLFEFTSVEHLSSVESDYRFVLAELKMTGRLPGLEPDALSATKVYMAEPFRLRRRSTCDVAHGIWSKGTTRCD